VSVDERTREARVEAEGQARTRTIRRTGRERALRALAPRLRLYQIGALVAVLGLWEWLGRRSPTYTFAAPSEIVTAAVDMIESGELQAAIGDSLVALLMGFGLAVVVGTAIGYALGWWKMLGRAIDPFVAALYVVPIAALIPVLIVWFGFGLATTVIVIFLFAIFEPVIAAEAAVRNVDRGYVDVARTFGANSGQTARKVVLPATLPFVLPASRMAASRAVKGMVLAEMLVAVSGLGGIIIRSARSFRMDEVFVAIIVIALIGVLLTSAVGAVERYLLRWRA
jgi:ABC-type nitrate/sulfonate/bicarbonate transport system permease component